ncbi:hypothetical protein LTR37_015363 [Vermiconidia calcicola]|uniref:Uncharacterized protein n=1 Tax=Vermiconidia calcicola TaxID=1690605 RepID=A0ACC3MSC5_9PEZI|nr:hypothetical protein LTR37_015363 [Vermiconidia calcicola]
MHSPLPDASALEAGIVEDTQPSRLSRVQDNVRNLLRNSRFGSVQTSPPATPPRNQHHHQQQQWNALPTPPQSPTRYPRTPPQPLPSPSAESSASTLSPPSTPSNEEVPAVHFAHSSIRHTLQQMAHQSALFNTRAVAALDHPDLSDPEVAVYVQRRQRGAWKRSRNGSGHGHGRKRRHVVAPRARHEAGSSGCLLCVLAALLLSAVVATYLVFATASTTDITPTFHILFILGIILATIVFAHTVVRLFLCSSSSRNAHKVIIVPAPRPKHHRQHHDHPRHIMPAIQGEATAFIPATPIPVHMPADTEVRPDSREALPTASAEITTPPTTNWDKDPDIVANPPPAYGRWRGSVRANPDLLHWQAVLPSPEPALPSPTYEEAMLAQRTGPPSYVTRESPARRVERTLSEGPTVQEQSADPEMVEGRGIGMGGWL